MSESHRRKRRITLSPENPRCSDTSGGRWSVRLTKKLMKENHTELWMWVAGEHRRKKRGWPRWDINGGDIPYIEYNECFPCEYTQQHEINEDEWNRCRCPLDFPGWEITDGSHEYCLGGLYDKWRKAKGKARTALAKQIAELPIRKKR